ncbi:MAG TPA: uroporphyrinogen decarboxylase family protein [Ktedonobacteraceae bacterium]|jgi:uroporphyrinogen decarboxylase|nr:uroporphyrinogen decarboxylase family protein [Ktedonobacteraceae bacterium]
MNKKERVDAALRGEPVDRVPASMWGHDFAREWNVQSFVEAMVENFTNYDWDYMKVNPRASYHVEDWKAKYRPANDKYTEPVFEGSPVRGTGDWKRLRVLEPDHGVLGEQLHALQLLNHMIGYDAYFLQTIFCPLGIAQYLVGGREPMLQSIREDRKALHTALRIITETFIQFAIASLEYGASGIFYATTGWAQSGVLTADQYREFGEQYDLEFLDAIKSRSKLTILHNCGANIYFDQLAAYPVQALSWDALAEGNPSLREGKRRSGKAVIGGVSGKTLLEGSAQQVQDEVGQAREQTSDLHLLLAPGCSISPRTPIKNLEAIRRSLS